MSKMRTVTISAGLAGLVCLVLMSACTPSAQEETENTTVDGLAPLYRHSMLVSDLERSLTLYRDVLGLELNRVSETPADSYSYTFFNLEPGAIQRFAYLDGEDGRANVLGIGEVPGIKPELPDSPRVVAWVQTVANVEEVIEQVEVLGLELIPPVEFISREAGRPGLEAGVIDFDGHLLLVYGLKQATDE